MRLTYQFQLIQAIRDFFNSHGFIDVMTPPLVQNPGMEVHIHPFQVVSAKDPSHKAGHLHTSPEFHMKELLSLEEEKLDNIFNISYCFRDEPSSPIHRNQFLMLEWYRKHAHYTQIMDDVAELIQYCLQNLDFKFNPRIQNSKMQRSTIDELFDNFLGFHITDFLDKQELIKKIKSDHKDIPLPSVECDWDDYFFLLFLNKIEPHFAEIPQLLVYEYPAPLAALSTIKVDNPNVCERFEVYVSGVELCNCFNELTNSTEQRKRFQQQAADKVRLYGYALPEPTNFYRTMDRGLPKSAGVALGIERLLLTLTDIKNPFFGA